MDTLTSTKDEVFCHEVARRAAARAALHLGIDFMSEEALDVMADVLLAYLDRFGHAMSRLVESSGRSSAHANVLDAFSAAKVCTSPTALQLHTELTSEENGGTPPRRQLHQPAWKDLADFVYGPKWQEKKKEPCEKDEESSPMALSLGQGKKMIRMDESTTNSAKKPKPGWDAPYLDEVPHFPQASIHCANPHKLPPSVAQSLHPQLDHDDENNQDGDKAEKEATTELATMSDQVFVTPWEEVSSKTTAKRPRQEEEEEEKQDGPPLKRARFQDDAEVQESTEPPRRTLLQENHTRPRYIPKFFPPLPQGKTSGLGRTVVDHDHNKALPVLQQKPEQEEQLQQDSSLLDVRSSLVKMKSNQYWGSGWDTPAKAGLLQVPAGRESSANADTTPSVIPLGRASGSRVSRILEGSIDPFH